ncbi:MAG: type-F conjugative transfer system secretin TraK [Oligoflexales bacterium]
MKNKARGIFAIVSLVLGGHTALAKTIYFGGATETVPIVYGGQTILRFEEPVKTISNAGDFIIKPVNDETPDYALLSIEPRVMSGKSDTVFMLSGGDVAKLRLSVVPSKAGMKLDSVYDIKSQKSLVESRAESAPYVGRLDLMAAMIRGDQVAGYDMSNPTIDLSSGPASTKVSLVKVYSGDEFKGYVYEISNLSSEKTFDLDVRQLQFGQPNQAILAYSDLDVLDKVGSGKNKTRLIVVAKPTAHYRNALLPVRVTRKADKAGGENE